MGRTGFGHRRDFQSDPWLCFLILFDPGWSRADPHSRLLVRGRQPGKSETNGHKWQSWKKRIDGDFWLDFKGHLRLVFFSFDHVWTESCEPALHYASLCCFTSVLPWFSCLLHYNIYIHISFISFGRGCSAEVVIRVSDRAGGMHSKCANESLACRFCHHWTGLSPGSTNSEECLEGVIIWCLECLKGLPRGILRQWAFAGTNSNKSSLWINRIRVKAVFVAVSCASYGLAHQGCGHTYSLPHQCMLPQHSAGVPRERLQFRWHSQKHSWKLEPKVFRTWDWDPGFLPTWEDM